MSEWHNSRIRNLRAKMAEQVHALEAKLRAAEDEVARLDYLANERPKVLASEQQRMIAALVAIRDWRDEDDVTVGIVEWAIGRGATADTSMVPWLPLGMDPLPEAKP